MMVLKMMCYVSL